MLSKKPYPKVPYVAIATIAGIITIIVGLSVLIGWQFDTGILKSILPGAVPMKANTAAAFLLSGVALLLIQRQVTVNKAFVRVFAVIITLTGFLTLCQYLFSWNFGIDTLLFPGFADAVGTSHPGRMSPDTALNFVFLGIAFYILTLHKYRNNILLGFSLFLALTIAGIEFLGYLSGFIVLSALAYTKMAIHTSITFIILCLGMLSVAYKQQPEKITIEQKTLAVFTVSVVIIVSLALLSVSGIRSLRQVNKELEHTQNTIQQLYIVQSGVIELKTGERGYLISGDEKHLEPAIKAKEKLPKLLDELTLLTRDEPRRQESLILLNQLIKERVDYTELLYDTYKTKGDEAGIALFGTDRGGILTDSIRAIIANMLEEENQILKIRNEAALQKTNETLIIVQMGIGVQILLLAFIFLIIRKDVTGRRKAENNLNESEEKFRHVFENSPVGKSLTTIDGKLRVNKEFCNIVGYSEEELSRLHWKEITHPDDIDESQRLVSSLITGEKEHARCQKRYIHKSGKIVWADLSTVLKKDKNGKPLYFITSIIDITERKRIEDEIRTLNKELEQRVADRTAELTRTYKVLQESEEKFRTITTSAQDAIIIIDNEGNISSWNEAAERLFGYSHQEVLGLELHSLLAPHRYHSAYIKGIKNFKMTGEGPVIDKTLELEALKKDGIEFPIELSVSAVKIKGKWNSIGILRDITERKKAEEKIKASLKEKEALVQEIHHRVKNNLQVVASLLNMQARASQDKNTMEILSESRNRINAMALIHAQLYETKNLSEVNMKGFVDGLIGQLFQIYPIQDVKITPVVHVADYPLPISKAVPVGLILNELLTNAFKYAFAERKKGEIKVSFDASEKGKISLTVSDDGVGLPQGFDISKSETIGLKLVKILVEKQLRGKFGIISKKGTNFKVEFDIENNKKGMS